MNVYHSIDEIPPIKNPVITLGTFDGVHLGHQKVIHFLKESAEEINGETVLFTFHPHPRIVLNPEDHGIQLIQPIDERIKKLAESGIDHLILFPFTKEFSRLSATEFIRDIMVNKLNVALMTIGYNHHFGRNREGNLPLLRELGTVYGFDVQEIPAFRQGDESISSTKIRNSILSGNIKKANHYLGETFCFDGKVIRGDHIGSKIGFPTANLSITTPFQIIPGNGVYAVQVSYDGRTYGGMMNIGMRPTVTENGEKRIEINLFNFNADIYNEVLRVVVLDRVRSEQFFNSLDELKQQLANDKAHCISIISEHSMAD